MIYFLIAFLFSFTTGLIYFIWKKLKNPQTLIIKPSNELKPYIQEMIDESIDLQKKEFRTLLGNYRAEYDKFIMKTASDAYVRNYNPFIPNCLIKAKEKGYFNDNNVIIINELRYKFYSLISVTENEIIISIRHENPLLVTNKTFEFRIYNNDMWAEIIVEKSLEDNK